VYRNTWKTKRNPNPLDPVYEHRDVGEGFRAGTGEINADYGFIKGSKPPGIPNEKQDPKRYLNTQDISGAQSSTRQVGCVKAGYVRQNVRNPNDCSDVGGAQQGTLRRYI